MKIGKEVEGRHIGLRTLFCSAHELMSDPNKVAKRAYDWVVQQIYISDLTASLDVSSDNVFLSDLADKYIVTVECRIVPEEINDKIDIMLNIDCPSFWNLRPDDQVKFSENLTVFSASLRNMTLTRPEEFEGDIDLD